METFLKDPIKHTQDVVGPAQEREIYFLCRRGNDSLISARALRRALQAEDPESERAWRVKDVIGGVRAWSREVDPEFPVY